MSIEILIEIHLFFDKSFSFDLWVDLVVLFTFYCKVIELIKSDLKIQ